MDIWCIQILIVNTRDETIWRYIDTVSIRRLTIRIVAPRDISRYDLDICNQGKSRCLFLAHLSTKCSWWAIVTGLCPSSVVVRRASSVVRACVVRKLFYLNIFSFETTHWILTKLHRNDPWVVPYQSCSNGSDWLHK